MKGDTWVLLCVKRLNFPFSQHSNLKFAYTVVYFFLLFSSILSELLLKYEVFTKKRGRGESELHLQDTFIHVFAY